jgi:rhodanese-related sulfurtransferase
MSTLTSITTEYNRNLAPAQLRSLIAQVESLQLVDVRESAEFASGRIAGARLLSLGEL